MSIDTYAEFLSRSQYFDGLNADQLSRILAISTPQTFARGETILKESDRGDTMLIILSGRVDITVSLIGSDRTEVIASLGDSEIVGEMILLGKQRRIANVIAKDDSTLLKWRSAELLSLFESDFQIGYAVMRNVAKQMAERLSAANQVLRNALTLAKGSAF